MPNLRPAVFLDLNGTLVMPVQAQSCADYTAIPGVIKAISLLNAAGYVCPVVTVQSRISKGYYTDQEFRRWFAAFQADVQQSGAQISGLYLCPHQASDNCACAKPSPLLYQKAAVELGIDTTRSFVVGDTLGDMQAADQIGARGCLVRTGWGPKTQGGEEEQSAAYTGDDLLDVSQWILRQHGLGAVP